MIGVLDDVGAEEVITMFVEVVVVDVRAGTVIGELAAAMVNVDMLEDMEIIIVVIALDFGVSVSYIVDVLTDLIVGVLSGEMIGGVSSSGVGVLTAAWIVLKFVTALSEEAIPCSSPAFSCWPNAVLDCGRVLHAWIPSYHECSSLALPALPQF